jgi:hypothetical protein
MSPRPWTDSILGPLTPWDTKVGDVLCDTCGKKIIADVKLGDLHDIAWRIEGARRRQIKEKLGGDIIFNKSRSARFFADMCMGNTAKWHSQCTLKWTLIIEQKLKEMGVF